MTDELSVDDLEQVYDSLAEAIDNVGPEKEALFLAKLVLILANDLGDRARILADIEMAGRDIEDEPGIGSDQTL